MKHIYTINYKLFESRENAEELIDAQTFDKAFRSLENAFKGVKEVIKTNIELCNYKPTDNPLIIETDTSETGVKFVLKFEIKEHWLSNFEQGD